MTDAASDLWLCLIQFAEKLSVRMSVSIRSVRRVIISWWLTFMRLVAAFGFDLR